MLPFWVPFYEMYASFYQRPLYVLLTQIRPPLVIYCDDSDSSPTCNGVTVKRVAAQTQCRRDREDDSCDLLQVSLETVIGALHQFRTGLTASHGADGAGAAVSTDFNRQDEPNAHKTRKKVERWNNYLGFSQVLGDQALQVSRICGAGPGAMTSGAACQGRREWRSMADKAILLVI